MKSLYAQYLKEKEGFDTFETEYGFISYQIRGEVAVGRDFFVISENRGDGSARKLWESLREQLIDEGISKFYVAVPTFRDDATRMALMYLVAGNAKIVDARDGGLVMEIDLCAVKEQDRR